MVHIDQSERQMNILRERNRIELGEENCATSMTFDLPAERLPRPFCPLEWKKYREIAVELDAQEIELHLAHEHYLESLLSKVKIKIHNTFEASTESSASGLRFEIDMETLNARYISEANGERILDIDSVLSNEIAHAWTPELNSIDPQQKNFIKNAVLKALANSSIGSELIPQCTVVDRNDKILVLNYVKWEQAILEVMVIEEDLYLP